MARTKIPLTLEAALPAGQKPTLKTIAQMSGLAVPTVSRALNDAPDIGRDTKILVRKIADEIGYVPNRAGVRLRTGRTNVVSLIMSTEHDNHTAHLISSVAGGLQGTRYHLNVTPYFPQDDFMKPVRYIVETGSADAVILNQIEPNDERVAYLMEKKFPFATHGRSNWADAHPYYDFDNHSYGALSMDALHARGRRRVAVVAPPIVQSYAQHFIAGLQESAQKNGIHVHVISDATSDCDIPIIVNAVKAALEDDPTLDGIAVASTNAALGAISALEQRDLTLGHEIDVVAKEAETLLKLFRPDIVSVSEAVGSAGDFLAKAAVHAIQNPTAPPMQYLEVPTTRF